MPTQPILYTWLEQLLSACLVCPDLAISFLLAHYIGIIIVGLIMRCHQGEESPEIPSQTPSLTRAFTRLAASKSPKEIWHLI